jgi:2-C-methyl-D-erythritol 4-phosphate cytidylyltransferase / 2-C-methyl-D-erythritol 2,4-cyclodiphosphate synthase
MTLTNPAPTVAVVIVAAGKGSRFGGTLPKQFHMLAAVPVLRRTLKAFADHGEVGTIVAVISPDHTHEYNQAIIGHGSHKLLPVAHGGATRQASVLAGLEALVHKPPQIVLIHDAARPFVSAQLISAAIAAARIHMAAVPGAPVTDTIISADKGYLKATHDRETLRAVQTPQAFDFELIITAHRKAAKNADIFTDDGSMAMAQDKAVHVFPGEATNIKITTPADMARAIAYLGEDKMISRTGTGFDVHAFKAGDHVWLCGLKIPHSHGFEAHSDGDVALHALTDALFGAMVDGDIGRHFPPSDERWRGAASDQFLAYAVARLQARGGVIDLLDVTLICDWPAYRRHARTHHANHRRSSWQCIGQGNHNRAPRFYRPQGRHCRHGLRDNPPASTRLITYF